MKSKKSNQSKQPFTELINSNALNILFKFNKTKISNNKGKKSKNKGKKSKNKGTKSKNKRKIKSMNTQNPKKRFGPPPQTNPSNQNLKTNPHARGKIRLDIINMKK
jgi:hypothetical protein